MASDNRVVLDQLAEVALRKHRGDESWTKLQRTSRLAVY